MCRISSVNGRNGISSCDRMQRLPVWIGAAHGLSALGEGVAAHVARMRSGGTALREWPAPASKPLIAGRLPEALLPDGPHRLLDLCLTAMLAEIAPLPNERWMLVLASTKGHIEALEHGDASASALPLLGEHMRQRCGRIEPPVVISLACASGTAALIHACTAIEQGHCDHALVVGIDVLSRFVLDGFASLYALDAVPCRPFDDKRAGTSLGEACAGQGDGSPERSPTMPTTSVVPRAPAKDCCAPCNGPCGKRL